MSTAEAALEVWVDGERVSSLPLSLLRALFYGDAVFETMRVVQGRPVLLEAHVERLLRSVAALGMTRPVSPSAFVEELTRVVAGKGEGERDRILRVLVARRASFGLAGGEAGPALRVAVLVAAPSPASSLELEAQTQEGRLHPLGGHKSTDYLGSIVALGRATAAGATEVLVVEEGKILGGVSSNVFGVLGVDAPRIVTPPLSDGVLPGVTRGAVCRLAAERGLPVEERSLAVSEIGALSECFLTSSIRGIVPVVRIDRGIVGEGQMGPVTASLRNLYEARILRGSLTLSPGER